MIDKLGQMVSGKWFGLPRLVVVAGGGLAVGLGLIFLRGRGGGGTSTTQLSTEDRSRLENTMLAMQNIMSEIQSGYPQDGTTLPPDVEPEPEPQHPGLEGRLINYQGGIYLWEKGFLRPFSTWGLWSYGLTYAKAVDLAQVVYTAMFNQMPRGEIISPGNMPETPLGSDVGQGIPVAIVGGLIGGGIPVLVDMFRGFRTKKRAIGQGLPAGITLAPVKSPRCIDAGIAEITLGFDSKYNDEDLP